MFFGAARKCDANSVHAVTDSRDRDAAGPRELNRDQAAEVMQAILSGGWSPQQIRGFLLDYNRRPASAAELSGFLDAVRGAAARVELSPEIAARAIDIVGTGGDKSGSVNVSTMAAFVVAGAGVPVCKHGNRSASSKCGTADVLEALGARIEQTPDQVARSVATVGFGFVFAPAFHPAFRHVGPVRRELAVPTVFNLLGPMANPAPVSYMLVGVADEARMQTMAAVLAQRTASALVVHGHGGLDELSLAGPNRAIATNGGVHAENASMTEMLIDATELGLVAASNDHLQGGEPHHNARVVTDVLSDQLRGPIRDVVVLNAGVALYVARAASSLREGIRMASESIASGKARSVLDAFVSASNLTS